MSTPNAVTMKLCHKCDTVKSISQFSHHATTKDGYDPRCKDCFKELVGRGTGECPRELDIVLPDLNNVNWQGGKYSGTVFKRSGENIYTVRVADKYKTFNPSNFNSDEDAFAAANQWRKQISDTLFLTKNKYRIIKFNEIPTYIIVQLSHNYATLLDFDMLDFVRSHTLSAGIGSTGPGSTYYVYVYDSVADKVTGLQTEIIRNAIVVDHYDRYTFDNRRCNLRPTDYIGNNSNQSYVSDVTYDYVNDKINVIISYDRKTQILTQMFNSINEARDWIKPTILQLELSKHNLTDDQVKLRVEYETIMEQYAPSFKWQDLNTGENVLKDQIWENEYNAVIAALSYTTKKEQIYLKYLSINPNYPNIAELVKPGIKIEHIVDNGREYKFCSCENCETWKEVSEFYKNCRTWDGLERWCKSCKIRRKK
jgi:hypothetical protein